MSRPSSSSIPQVLNSELYKTELCNSWERNQTCVFGKKCRYAHGVAELKDRIRVSTYHIQPCVDSSLGKCLYGNRCNYAHPGDTIRTPCNRPHFDSEYFKCVAFLFPQISYPFGIFV